MSTTRIVNGVEYTIPPGTEHVWTPPENVVVTPAPVGASSQECLDRLGAHGIVREQNSQVIDGLIAELEGIWTKFKNKTINESQLISELANFRTTKLSNPVGFDDITVQAFEETMVIMMQESKNL